MPWAHLSKAAARLAAAAGLALAIAAPASAQNDGNPLQSSDRPVQIEADMLEVLDDQSMAVFTGNVVAKQDGTTLQTASLKVFYAGGSVMQQAAAQSENNNGGGGGDGQRITRLEAEGKVVVTTREQRATGDRAIFQMDTNTVTLTGDVVLSQGQNVLNGTELVVNLDTGRSRLVSNRSGGAGRVRGVFQPSGRAPAGQ
ncbi:LptA/OstA family protein [Lutibaculum baratangense]|uniref:OstA-like protein n=1 Tax=Lutibaculum baratangense AMV1 TaxID=631454 RepID=V4RKT9_9HYPH|nr:LptA/OstA family protein [Lutibaculum baratangense]ESR25899.1 OstA-like protein [Lutibaculum baratangense AMV1]